MRKMKDSGIEWIGDIPANWEVVKVKNIFNRKNEKAKLENPIVLSLARSGVKVRDISNNEGQLAESYYNYNPVSKGDLLLNPMDLYSGANCSISNVEGVISPAYINLRAKNNIVARYYDYYFKTQYWSMALFAHGKGVSFDNRWTLNLETLMNYNLPLTSLEEQELIADYLDEKVKEIDNIISKTQETIEEYKKYKQSVITEAVTKGLNPNVEMKDSGIEWIGEIPKDWNIGKIKNFYQVICGSTPKSQILSYWNGDIIWITPSDYKTDDIFINSSKRKITEEGIKSCGTTLVPKGSIIVSNRAPIGSVAIANTELCTNQGCKSLVNKCNLINNKFMYYYISIMEDVLNVFGRGTTFLELSTFDLSNFNCVFMNKKEQEEIVEYLDKKCAEIDNLIRKKQELITQLETYKKSLIYECVTGKKEVALAYAY